MNAIVEALVLGALLLVAVGGCHDNAQRAQDDPLRMQDSTELDSWMVTTSRDEPIRAAIIAQHTLYDYHFQPNSARLTTLGARDLGVLAEAFAKAPGELSVRRGEVSASLHDERVKTVVAELAKAGVAVERMTMTEGLPGGSGMSSVWVLTVREGDRTILQESAMKALVGSESAKGTPLGATATGTLEAGPSQ